MRLFAAMVPLALWGGRAATRDLDRDGDVLEKLEDIHEDEREEAIEKLKLDLFKLSPAEAEARFGAIGPRGAAPPRQDQVDHFVVLYMENHAADQFFGCMDLPGFDGIPQGGGENGKIVLVLVLFVEGSFFSSRRSLLFFLRSIPPLLFSTLLSSPPLDRSLRKVATMCRARPSTRSSASSTSAAARRTTCARAGRRTTRCLGSALPDDGVRREVVRRRDACEDVRASSLSFARDPEQRHASTTALARHRPHPPKKRACHSLGTPPRGTFRGKFSGKFHGIDELSACYYPYSEQDDK